MGWAFSQSIFSKQIESEKKLNRQKQGDSQHVSSKAKSRPIGAQIQLFGGFSTHFRSQAGAKRYVMKPEPAKQNYQVAIDIDGNPRSRWMD